MVAHMAEGNLGLLFDMTSRLAYLLCVFCFLSGCRSLMLGSWSNQILVGAREQLRSLQKLSNGVVKKFQRFTYKAFGELLPFQESMGLEARASDVLVAGSMGAGTTWLSHILHGLRTDGSLDFDDLNQVFQRRKVTFCFVLRQEPGSHHVG